MTGPRHTDIARVRVYNVGFGESILVDLPRRDGQRARLLIDCGSVSFGTSGHSNETLVERIVGDITVDDVPRLDVVVATHRHRDHVSGFARPEWRDVVVGEVWMPWTENPADDAARELRVKQIGLADAIVASRDRLAAAFGIDERTVEVIANMGFNAQSNVDAWATLRSGFAGQPPRHYLSRRHDVWHPDALGGIGVHVLGPSHDEVALSRMDPPSGQSYLAMLPVASFDAVAAEDRPFPWLAAMDYVTYGSAELNGGTARTVDHGFAKGQLRKLVVNDSLLTAAVLDHAINNTTLVLGFEVGDQMLLFVGDAQWGSWQLTLDETWSADIVHRTSFYKVGHHGSHNATPRRFVEDHLGDGVPCVASVGDYSRWEGIPYPALMNALAQQTHRDVVTTKEPPAAPPVGVVVEEGGKVIEFTIDVSW